MCYSVQVQRAVRDKMDAFSRKISVDQAEKRNAGIGIGQEENAFSPLVQHAIGSSLAHSKLSMASTVATSVTVSTRMPNRLRGVSATGS